MKKLDIFLVEEYSLGSFNFVLQKFLKKRSDRIAEASLAHLFHSLFPMGEAMENQELRNISRKDVKEYVDSLWFKYAAGTIRPVIGDIQQFARWCKRKGYHKKNFAKRLKKPRVRSRQANKAASDNDAQLTFAFLRDKLSPFVYRDVFGGLTFDSNHRWLDADIRYLRDLFILSFLYETGCRGRELTQLSVRAMDQATEAPSKIYLVVTGVGKTNDHDYYFTHATAELWHLWKQVRKDKLLYAICGWRRGEKHRPMFTNGVSQMLYQRSLAAGAESPFRAHSLRHAKVKRSRKKVGLDIAKVLVDHADIETTWGYANIDQEELEEAVLATGISFDIWEKSVVANVF